MTGRRGYEVVDASSRYSQMTIFDSSDMGDVLKNNGFTVKNGILPGLLVVSYNGTEIMYLRENADETYNTIEFLRFPTSFSQTTYNNSIDRVVEILNSVVRINFT